MGFTNLLEQIKNSKQFTVLLCYYETMWLRNSQIREVHRARYGGEAQNFHAFAGLLKPMPSTSTCSPTPKIHKPHCFMFLWKFRYLCVCVHVCAHGCHSLLCNKITVVMLHQTISSSNPLKIHVKFYLEIVIRTSIRGKMDNSELLYTYMTNIGFKVWNLHGLNDWLMSWSFLFKLDFT